MNDESDDVMESIISIPDFNHEKTVISTMSESKRPIKKRKRYNDAHDQQQSDACRSDLITVFKAKQKYLLILYREEVSECYVFDEDAITKSELELLEKYHDIHYNGDDTDNEHEDADADFENLIHKLIVMSDMRTVHPLDYGYGRDVSKHYLNSIDKIFVVSELS